MSASVTFSGTATYTLVLHDTTQGWTQTITKNQSGLARSSAEVITEAPSSSSGVLPLADFHTVSYSTSSANGTSLGSQSPIVDHHDQQQRCRQGLDQLDQLRRRASATPGSASN